MVSPGVMVSQSNHAAGNGFQPYCGVAMQRETSDLPQPPPEGDRSPRTPASGNPGTGAQPPAPTSTKIFEEILELGDETVWVWTQGYYRRQTDVQKEGMLKIDLPLHKNGNGAHLILMKDLSRDPLQYFTLRRLEHLRRTIRYNLTRLQKNGRLEG